MQDQKLTIQISDLELAICRFPPDTPLPDWSVSDRFVSITRTAEELSVVCREELVPKNVKAERNWRMIRLKGSFDFYLTGVLASLVQPLSAHGIPLFAISTFDTDYLLLQKEYFDRAIGILKSNFHIEPVE